MASKSIPTALTEGICKNMNNAGTWTHLQRPSAADVFVLETPNWIVVWMLIALKYKRLLSALWKERGEPDGIFNPCRRASDPKMMSSPPKIHSSLYPNNQKIHRLFFRSRPDDTLQELLRAVVDIVALSDVVWICCTLLNLLHPFRSLRGNIRLIPDDISDELLPNTAEAFEQHTPAPTGPCYHLTLTARTSNEVEVNCTLLVSLILLFCLSVSLFRSLSLRPRHIMTDLLYIKGPCPMRPHPVTSLSLGLYKTHAQGGVGDTNFQRGTVHKHPEDQLL